MRALVAVLIAPLVASSCSDDEKTSATTDAGAGLPIECLDWSDAAAASEQPTAPVFANAPDGGVSGDAGRAAVVTGPVLVPAQPVLPGLVKIYSVKTCAAGDKTKAWLDENRLAYKELDANDPALHAEAMALFPDKPMLGVPAIQWGRSTLAGFDPKRMEKLLYPDGRMIPERAPTPTTDSASAQRSAGPDMYTYKDAKGRTHVVPSLDDVPARYRSKAKRHKSY